MRKRHLLLLFMVSAFLIGCVPFWSRDYYKPAAEGGTAKSSECSGTSGPPDTMEFVRNDVVIRVKLFELGNGFSPLIQFQVPEGRLVRIANPAVRVSTASAPAAIESILKPLTYQDQAPWKIGETVKGKGGWFAMDAKIIMPKANVVRLRLPELYVDGRRVELPEISFTKERFMEVFAPTC